MPVLCALFCIGSMTACKTRPNTIVTPAYLPQSVETANAQRSPPVETRANTSLEEKWGIQVASLRLSAGGYIVDFRYKVLDPKKAAALAKPEIKPGLVDAATGATLGVPRGPKTGPLRQTAENLVAGKTYFVLFANPQKVVQPGSEVSVLIGDFSADRLVVE